MSYRGVVKYGHRKAISSAFEHREDAEHWLAGMTFGVKDVTISRVIQSKRKPEIVRHCGISTGVVNHYCPDCRQKIAA